MEAVVLDDKMKVVVLLSGGMDSVCALYYSKDKYNVVSALSFDYGSKHNKKELPFASHHCEKLNIPHTIIKIDFIDDYFKSNLLKNGKHFEEGSNDKTIVPFRNGIMLSIAAGYAESRDGKGIVIASHSGNYSDYPDCREKFLKLMSQSICAGTYNKIKVLRPFVFMTLEEVVRKGRELNIDFSQTWSCDDGMDIHCGECDTCIGRRGAFNSARVSDPTEYSFKEPLPLEPMD